MGYESGQSNFAGGGPDDAFWIYTRDDGSQNVCATSALQVLHDVNAALGLSESAWDTALITALRRQAYTLAAQSDADPAWNAVAARLGAQPPQATRLDVLFALWLAYYEPHGLRFDALSLPASTTLPAIDTPVAGLLSPIACFDPHRDPNPANSAADRSVAVSQSTNGIRLHPGESLPTYDNGPHGYVGPSNNALVIGGALVVGVGLYLWVTSKEFRTYGRRSSR